MFRVTGHKHQVFETAELLLDLPDIDHEPRFAVKVIGNNELTHDVFTLSLERPEKFKFIPGQYAWVLIPELSKQYGVVDRRAYSITSGVDGMSLEFLIRDGSSDSEYILHLRSLKVGDEIEIIGPMGSAFAAPINGVIMISGGTGISPFLSIIRSKPTGDISLIAYDSRKKPIYNKDEFDNLSSKYGYEVSFRKNIPRRSDFNKIVDKKDTRLILISGSQIFVDFVTSILLRRGIKADRMRYEENRPQARTDEKMKKTLTNLFNKNRSKVTKGFPGVGDLFFQVTKQISNHVALTDRNGHILFANQAASDMTGYAFEEMKGQTPRLWGGLSSGNVYKAGWHELMKGNAIKGSVINRRRGGEIYIAIVTMTPILFKGRVIMHVATEEDITALRNIDKVKTEFVSFASHQLRAPMSITSWYAEMLLNGDAGKLSKEQSDYVREMRASNRRMSELVSSLLDVSRLELGTFVIEPTLTDIVKLANDVIDEQKNEIAKKKIQFSFSSVKDIPIINGDPKLLHMIIQNLLSNAIKYTPEKGSVKLNLSSHDRKKILLKVSDTGFGIPKNQQDKIFTKLFRADNARLQNSDGTGLGLYIIKSIIEKTGGKIWFESEENKGSTFYVLIPIGKKPKK